MLYKFESALEIVYVITTETLSGDPYISGTLEPKISSVYKDFLTFLNFVPIGKYQLRPGFYITFTGLPKVSITTISLGSI